MVEGGLGRYICRGGGSVGQCCETKCSFDNMKVPNSILK